MTGSNSVRHKSGESRVLDWQKDVARSTATRAPPPQQPSTTQIFINHITTPKVTISHPAPQSKQDTEISTRAIIGTILGASAGAAVAYAISKGESENRQEQGATHTTYPVKRVSETAVFVRPPLTDVENYQSHRSNIRDKDRPRSHHSADGSRVETILSSKHSRRNSHSEALRTLPAAPQSHTGQTVARTSNGTKILFSPPKHSRSSHASPSSKRKEYALSAADVPLPQSRVSTMISKHDTVVPEDSISQVSTVRPHSRAKSSHHHHHHSSKSDTSRRSRPSYRSSQPAR